MKINLVTKTKEETIALGEFIGKQLSEGSVLTMSGDLGAGKTTFVKGIGKALNIEDEINSPTFNILKCYFSSPYNLYHIDAYRLEGVASENKNIGLEEVIEGDGVCVIEWPQFIPEFINFKLSINIEIKLKENNEREFSFETENENYKDLFESLEGYKNV